jgi:D-alanyl-D-alanine carboxypeptidase
MYRTPAAGNLRAKTGTMDRTSALTGLVRSAEGERLAFSILVNGARDEYGAKRVENEIGARLASFRRGVEMTWPRGDH